MIVTYSVKIWSLYLIYESYFFNNFREFILFVLNNFISNLLDVKFLFFMINDNFSETEGYGHFNNYM